jgi:uncharacterized repeat protein (TIGR03803 family)
VYSAIWAKADRGSVRSVLLVALAMALLAALYVPAQAQTGGAAAPSWRGSQGAGARPAANGPGQGRLHRPRRAASAQTSSNLDIESVLYNFCSQGGVYCTDGIQPFAGLIEDASGNLYGTTNGGGSTNNSDCNAGSCGYGTVFKLTPSGSDYTKTVLYNFCSQTNCTDGANPYAGLIEDSSGNLYGTTYNGGATGGGTVFKLTPSGNGYIESVLYNFCSQSQGSAFCTDGVNPYAGLIEDSSGNLYGTTNLGGTGVPLVNGGYAYGTVFMLAPSGSGYNYTVLYNFCPPSSTAFCTDGAAPNAALILDASGNLYGTTALGGAGTQNCIGLGCGTVYKLSPNGSGYVETVLYSFCSQGGSNCTDGAYPYGAGLIEDASGNLYGTTSDGGVNSCDTPGCGTVFKLAPNGDGSYTESVLHSFDYTDGAGPDAGLIEDASGNLYGTTSSGGTGLSWECEGCSSGTVFELSPSGNGYTETVLYSFCSEGGTQCTDGAMPMAGVIQDASGNLYGSTEFGGTNGIDWGTVFKLSPAPPGFTVSASPTSLTIAAGQSGTATFTVTPENGFDSAVSFSCSGLSAEASCSFSPQTVTPSGGKSATTTLTITTTAPTSAALRRAGRGPQVAYALLLPGLALGLVGAARGKRTRRGLRLLGLVVPLGLALALASCGGGGGSGSGGNTGTPPGTSTVTVTAGVTGGTSQTATLTVTVTQ